ncbi:MAG: helix-turn-helix domain-containing protein [Candidatus Aenigmarchaeota archaeon]|nr:helix-turn-helix domain-containing protein [Candidatus Aenigmarchaeota archaeon]
MTNFKEYIKVKEASEILGVSVMTLHRWDAKGKLKSFRHPINLYRLYKKDELEKLLKKIYKN